MKNLLIVILLSGLAQAMLITEDRNGRLSNGSIYENSYFQEDACEHN